MTDLLVKFFIKDSENIKNEKVRLAYGTLSSFTGIVCNILLFVVKFGIGFVLNSVAITSDAFNNLSDCLSCIVSLFGYRLSSQPADREHPFGHGRMEYISSFVLAIIIFLVAFELLKTSVDKIFHPEELHFSWSLFFILLLSVLVKVWMSLFNKKLGNKIDSTTMLATAQDSLNDVMTTSATLVALLLAKFIPSIPFDGIAGVIIALFIFYAGYNMTREIIDKLLGNPASGEMVQEITEVMLSYPEILNVHDMIIHDYGPGKQIGSAHAEVDSRMDFLKAHDIIDQAEKKVYDETKVLLTIHLDPVEVDNPIAESYRQKIETILNQIDPSITFHDFRIVIGETHTNLIFDIVVPFQFKMSNHEIKEYIDKELQKEDHVLLTVITFDHDFSGN